MNKEPRVFKNWKEKLGSFGCWILIIIYAILFFATVWEVLEFLGLLGG